jgi:hypothetical protein
MRTGSVLALGIVLLAIVLALTVAIIATAPYIAVAAVLLSLGYALLTWNRDPDDGPPPGPPGPPTVP